MGQIKEQRHGPRYPSSAKVIYHFEYDVETKVRFQLVDEYRKKVLSEKHPGISENVSTEGICFRCDQPLKKGTPLNLEVVLPTDEAHPIHMKGIVRWSHLSAENQKGNHPYSTGVQLTSIEGEEVHDSVYYDENYQVEWSAVLEAVLGTYRIHIQEKKNQSKAS